MDIEISNDQAFKSAFKYSAVGMALLSTKGIFIKGNEALCRILGYSEADLVGKNFRDITYEEDLNISVESVNKLLYSNIPNYQIEKRYYHKNGRIVWMIVAVSLVKDKNHKPLYFIAQFQDITRRKADEILLKESEERFKLAVKGSRDGIWDWPDITKDAQYWSPVWKELLGYRDDEIEASYTKFIELLHPYDRHLFKDLLPPDKDLESGFDMEFRLRSKAGKYKWFQGKGIVTLDNGKIRMTGSLTDITSRKASEAKLKEFNKALERRNEDLNSFAYIASHDLKEPIRGIYNNVILLEEDNKDKIDANCKKRLDRISILCFKMEKLINDLLNYARMKDQEFVIKRIDLNSIINEIKDTIELSYEKQNIYITITQELPKIICDTVTVAELFRNLINNGIKYNENKEKHIEIGYKEITENRIPKYAFYVKDNGTGIEKKYQKEIFNVFKRLDNTEDIVKGTGMGLSFVKRIIERHGGKIWLESEIGKGSIFYFTLN